MEIVLCPECESLQPNCTILKYEECAVVVFNGRFAMSISCVDVDGDCSDLALCCQEGSRSTVS